MKQKVSEKSLKSLIASLRKMDNQHPDWEALSDELIRRTTSTEPVFVDREDGAAGILSYS